MSINFSKKMMVIFLLLNSFVFVRGDDIFKKATALYEQSQWEEAEQEYDRIFQNMPPLENLDEEAIKKEAASLGVTKDELIRGRVNCADVKFALQKFTEGCKYYQYRIYGEQFGRKPLKNEWDGSDPAGKTIVIYSERDRGAFGDTFIMSGLIRWLKKQGAQIILVPQKPLQKLYSTPGTIQSTYVDQVKIRGEELFDHDAEVYLWSLLKNYYDKNKDSSFPIQGPWFSGKKELPAWVEEKLKPHIGKLLVGFWYRSSGSTSKAADYRTLDRDPGANRVFKAFGNIPGVTLICLEGMGHQPVHTVKYEQLKQKDELENLDPTDVTEDDPSEVVTFDSKKFDCENGAFVDTTTLMGYIKKQGGCLVGCDTGLLNLAAGVEECNDEPSTFALLNQKADFRWGAQRGTRDWHMVKGVKVFQCSKQGEWEKPLGKLREVIKERARKLAEK